MKSPAEEPLNESSFLSRIDYNTHQTEEEGATEYGSLLKTNFLTESTNNDNIFDQGSDCDNVKVVIRIRPLNDRELKSGGKRCV